MYIDTYKIFILSLSFSLHITKWYKMLHETALRS